LKNKVADVLAGSVIDRAKLEKRKNLLLVVGAVRLESAIELITEICEESSLEKWPLSGIIICGEGEISDETRAIIDKHETPLLQTELDTYGVVLKVSRIEVKINRDTPWKIKRAIDLFEANVDLDYILEQISKP
jgi:BioD-like phosphotransacetylase family protein